MFDLFIFTFYFEGMERANDGGSVDCAIFCEYLRT